METQPIDVYIQVDANAFSTVVILVILKILTFSENQVMNLKLRPYTFYSLLPQSPESIWISFLAPKMPHHFSLKYAHINIHVLPGDTIVETRP